MRDSETGRSLEHNADAFANPTFRGMGQSLMTTFDQIRIMDLRGNAKKRERCPDGSKDEIVFDISQGVARCLMIKLPKVPGAEA